MFERHKWKLDHCCFFLTFCVIFSLIILLNIRKKLLLWREIKPSNLEKCEYRIDIESCDRDSCRSVGNRQRSHFVESQKSFFWIHTSVWLIVCPKVAADSEGARQDMKKIIIRTKTPTNEHSIPKIFRIYIYSIIKISTVFDSRIIIEYHIFCLKIPIIQANLGKKKQAKFTQKSWFFM